jgi:hypothetical protein
MEAKFNPETGSVDLFLIVNVHTNPFDFASVNIASGETASPVKKPNIKFNAVVDPTTLATTEYTLTPAPNGAPADNTKYGQYTGGEIILGGNYAPDTEYTLTIKAGATVEDWYGAVWTNDADKVITWKTAPKVLLTSTTSDDTVLQKTATDQLIGISLSWNANMDVATLDATEFSVVNADTMQPVAGVVKGNGASSANCGVNSQTCSFRIRANFAPGDYIFTLKAGATVTDKIGTNTYTQAADKVIHFTVKAPVAAPTCL